MGEEISRPVRREEKEKAGKSVQQGTPLLCSIELRQGDPILQTQPHPPPTALVKLRKFIPISWVLKLGEEKELDSIILEKTINTSG